MAKEYETDMLNMSWSQRIQFVRTTSVFFAITVMVYTRRKLGFRMMNPTVLLIITIVMLTIAALFQEPLGPYVWPLVLYALGAYGLGTYHRWRRWQELCNGERWHTFAPGISYLEALPWPPFMLRCRRITRFVEPPIVIVLGFIVGATLSRGLGVWLIWSGIFLFIFEQDLFEKTLASSLDTLDGYVFSEVQEEMVKHFEQAQPDQKQRTIEDTAGIVTGIAPDIEKQVALRKAKRPKAPDNLVTAQAASPN